MHSMPLQTAVSLSLLPFFLHLSGKIPQIWDRHIGHLMLGYLGRPSGEDKVCTLTAPARGVEVEGYTFG